MNTARIAELLESFFRAPRAGPGNSGLVGASHSEASAPCQSEPGKTKEEAAVLSPAQLQHISTYIDILIRWNARINLTAIRDPEDIVTRHFGESLFAASRLFPPPSSASSVSSMVSSLDSIGDNPRHSERDSAPNDATHPPRPATSDRITLADLGSGAGFPGLPIKLWAPQISLTLIESNHKKAAFLREVARSLTLTDVNIQNKRAEILLGNSYDVVTLRAVECFESILPVAAALVAPLGRLALLIGASQHNQGRASQPGFTWSKPIPIPHSRARVLLIGHRPPTGEPTA
jgi:16S rRNA (guanine527-N7)-methyltransferase